MKLVFCKDCDHCYKAERDDPEESELWGTPEEDYDLYWLCRGLLLHVTRMKGHKEAVSCGRINTDGQCKYYSGKEPTKVICEDCIHIQEENIAGVIKWRCNAGYLSYSVDYVNGKVYTDRVVYCKHRNNDGYCPLFEKKE